jgi:alpha-galactosidase
MGRASRPLGVGLDPAAAIALIAVVSSFLLTSCTERVRSATRRDRWTIANDALTMTIERGADGRLGMTQLKNRTDGREWIAGDTPSPLFQLQYRIGGETHALTGRSDLQVRSAEVGTETGGAQRLTLTVYSPEAQIEAVLYWRCLPGTGPIQKGYTLENQGARPIRILRADTLSQLLKAPGPPTRLMWVHKGTYAEGLLRVHDHRLREGETQELLCSGTETRDDLDVVPWFLIEHPDGGGLYFAWEFSGFGRIEIARSATRILVTGGLEPGRFSHVLKPGARLEVPEAMFGTFRGTPDDGANAFHQFLRRQVMPQITDPLYPRVHYNTWRSLGLEMDEASLLRHVELAAELGAELFHLDAGWMREMGDWRPDPRRFPHGLQPIVDRAHARGLKVGLWVPFAQISRERYEKHPNWLIQPYDPSALAFDNPIKTLPMCLGSPAVQSWVRTELDRVVRDYKIDFLEYDQPFLEECRYEGHGHQSGDGNYQAVRALYRLYDDLLARYPSLLLESCMNGGHITDYGILRRTHVFSLTDLYDPLSNRIAVYGATYPFPASYCEGYMQEAADEPPDYQFRSFMMGVWSISANPEAWSTEKLAACKRNIALYKRLRPLIRNGNVYHVLPQADGLRWDGLEYYDPRSGRGVLYVFRPPKSAVASQQVSLAGLTPDAAYQVEFEDTHTTLRLTGHELMSGSLSVMLAKPFDTAIVHLTRQEE